jgi:transposase
MDMYAENFNEEQEGHKDCLRVKGGEENADINAAFNIAYRASGYIPKVGVTVNIP